MHKIFIEIRGVMLKAVCIFVALFLCGNLFANRITAYGDCSRDCCCQSSMQYYSEKPVQSPVGCCSKASQKPCDMQSTEPFSSPEVVSVCNSVFHLDVFDLTTARVSIDGDPINSGDNLFFHSISQKARSPLLFIQNQSFLI